MCMCACVWVRVGVCMCACVGVWVHVWVYGCMNVCVCELRRCVYVGAGAWVCEHVWVRVCGCAHVYG